MFRIVNFSLLVLLVFLVVMAGCSKSKRDVPEPEPLPIEWFTDSCKVTSVIRVEEQQETHYNFEYDDLGRVSLIYEVRGQDTLSKRLYFYNAFEQLRRYVLDEAGTVSDHIFSPTEGRQFSKIEITKSGIEDTSYVLATHFKSNKLRTVHGINQNGDTVWLEEYDYNLLNYERKERFSHPSKQLMYRELCTYNTKVNLSGALAVYGLFDEDLFAQGSNCLERSVYGSDEELNYKVLYSYSYNNYGVPLYREQTAFNQVLKEVKNSYEEIIYECQ